MSTRILAPLSVVVTDGVSLREDFAYDAEAYDVIEVVLAAGASAKEVSLQPGAATQVHLLGIKANIYTQAVPGTDDISFKVHDVGNPAIELGTAILLTGVGAISVLGAVPDKLYFYNAGALSKNITIVIARDATP